MSTSPGGIAELIEQIHQGRRVKFLYFWGHQPERDGSVGRGCLSQWWPAPFTVDDKTFATAEHYMMWRKALLFDDPASAEQILEAPHPHRAKQLGRGVRGFDEQQWEACRYDIVVEGSIAKFSQHLELRRFLVGTGERVLVEASPRDSVWGIGLTQDDPRANDPEQWQGLNLLGFALAEARNALAGLT